MRKRYRCEPVRGSENLSGRSDLYSLACVVYEMLTGSPPFSGPNAQAIMARQVTQAAEPLRMRRPEVSGMLEQTLARSLAKDPAARFVTVAEESQRPVGFAELEPDGHIDRVYVSADRQRRGIGRQLLAALIAEARRVGLARLFTEASITARPFFESQGFKKILGFLKPLVRKLQ